jgi:phage-related protein
MPSIGSSCQELRIPDAGVTWRIIYRVDDDAIAIAEVFPKKQQATPARVIRVSKDRRRRYDVISRGGG